jgi:hypothetical protein
MEEVLAGRRRTLGDDRPQTLGSINNLGALRKAKGDYAGAEPLYEEALTAMRRTLGDEHPSTRTCINNLIMLRKAKRDYAGAPQRS